MPIHRDNLETIGRTPLVSINRLARGLGAAVAAKIEGRNPAFSVKCRIGAAMILDAERKGKLAAGANVVEATSGNTGIALAFACAARGYNLTLTMPETMSLERRAMLRSFGAELVLTPANEGMRGALIKAEELAEQPGWFTPRQFENPANPQVHFETTGPEIWEDTDGKIDVLVSGVGTGGTITGVGRYLKQERRKNVYIVAVEPAGSPVLSGGNPGRHKIQGIGAGFIPPLLDQSVIDEIQRVTDDEAITMARRLMKEEGIPCGISCGAAMTVALRLAGRREFAGRLIVAVLPDASERYLSTELFEGFTSPALDRELLASPNLTPPPFDTGDEWP